jgi:15-cis-phytoene synthase
MSAAVQQIPVQSFPTKSQLAVAYSVCRAVTRSAAKNFYYAFLVLPAPKRRALYAIYAYMRRCDDLADDVSLTAHERRQKLGAWVEAFHATQAGQPTDDPVLLALTDALRSYQIPVVLLDQLAYGTAMDIEESDPRPADPSSASPVELAERCGLAFQLTNILRDVKEDAAMGRVYLPQEDLTRFDIAASELRAGKDLERIRPLLAREAERAREFYRAADQLLPLIDEDSQPALWVLVTIYRRLLEKIARGGFDVFHEKISLTVRQKLVILGKGFLKRLS